MAKPENTPEAPQSPAVGPETEPAADPGSVPESLAGDTALVDELTAKLDTATGELETLRGNVTDLEARAVAAETALERERVARRFNLPDELVGFLKGETAEELEAEAQTLSKWAGSPGNSVGVGGLDPTNDAVGSAAIADRVNHRRREL